MQTANFILVVNQKRETNIYEFAENAHSIKPLTFIFIPQNNNNNLIKTCGKTSVYRNSNLQLRSTLFLNSEGITKLNKSISSHPLKKGKLKKDFLVRALKLNKRIYSKEQINDLTNIKYSSIIQRLSKFLVTSSKYSFLTKFLN